MTEEEYIENNPNAAETPAPMEQEILPDVIPENDVQLQALILEPAAKNFYPELVRDLKLGNLNEAELEYVRESLRTAECLYLMNLKKSAASFIRDALIICNTSGSRKGFQQHIQRSSFISREETLDDKTKNAFGKIFGGKKEKGGKF